MLKSGVKKLGSSINIRSLINEEKSHLQEMVDSLNQELPNWKELIAPALRYEELLFQLWCKQIDFEINMFLDSTKASMTDNYNILTPNYSMPISNLILSH